MASRYIQGSTFAMQELMAEARQSESLEQSAFCNPTALHDTLVLRLAVLEEGSTQRDQPVIDAAYLPLANAAKKALSCTPADSLAWLILFWLELRKARR